jgi:hypothetical protein
LCISTISDNIFLERFPQALHFNSCAIQVLKDHSQILHQNLFMCDNLPNSIADGEPQCLS